MAIKISAVIITHNETHNIQRCLDSLKSVADEIVIVDSFSTDSTLEICKKYTDKVFQIAWLGYAAQKNTANSYATNDWVLSLDADEALSPALAQSILAIKNNATADGYMISRMTNYCGKWIRHGDWYPDAKLRLWNRNKGNWQGLIHEKVELATPNTIHKLNGDILHYSFYSTQEHLAQMYRFTELMAQDNVNRNKNATIAKIIFSPAVKFFKAYILRIGFLDGYQGFLIASLSAFATFIKYVRTRELAEENVKKGV
jgi:glycosyltransferase involved in cell wall biosynthesis